MYPFWTYWNLYHRVTFDGINKLIYINEGETLINVEIDLYSDWKEWTLIEQNSGFLPAMRNVGGDPLPGGDKLGNTFFLTNGWRIVMDHGVNFVGNLYTDEGDSPFITQAGVQLSTSTISNLVQKIAPDLSLINVPTAIQNAQAVWNALLADFIAANTFGKRLQDTPALTAALIPSAPTVAQIADAVLDETLTDHLGVGSTGLAIAQTQADAASAALDAGQTKLLVELLLKYESNRTKVDNIAKTLTVYDNDGTSILKVFNLKDFTGTPSVTTIAERIPV